MKDLTIEELEEKYSNIEDKVPSIFKDYNEVLLQIQQDLYCTWNINNSELYRVISLVGIKTKSNVLYKHLDNRFSYMGLYPHRMISYDKIVAENITKEGSEIIEKILENIYKSRKTYFNK